MKPIRRANVKSAGKVVFAAAVKVRPIDVVGRTGPEDFYDYLQTPGRIVSDFKYSLNENPNFTWKEFLLTKFGNFFGTLEVNQEQAIKELLNSNELTDKQKFEYILCNLDKLGNSK